MENNLQSQRQLELEFEPGQDDSSMSFSPLYYIALQEESPRDPPFLYYTDMTIKALIKFYLIYNHPYKFHNNSYENINSLMKCSIKPLFFRLINTFQFEGDRFAVNCSKSQTKLLWNSNSNDLF